MPTSFLLAVTSISRSNALSRQHPQFSGLAGATTEFVTSGTSRKQDGVTSKCMDQNHTPTWCPGDRGPATCPAEQAPARGPDDQGFLPRLASLLVGWPWASHLAFPSCSFLMGSGGYFRPYLFYREAPGESYKCSLLTRGHEAGQGHRKQEDLPGRSPLWRSCAAPGRLQAVRWSRRGARSKEAAGLCPLPSLAQAIYLRSLRESRAKGGHKRWQNGATW